MEILLLILKISGFCFAFSFIWLFLVYGAVGKLDANSAKARTPNFAIKGKVLGKAFAAILIVPIAYMIWTGSVDTIVYATSSVGLIIGALACWRAANSLGVYAHETEEMWRKTRLMTHLQAFGLVLFIIIIEKGQSLL